MASYQNRRRTFYKPSSEKEPIDPQKGVENNETNFPTLCSVASKAPTWSTGQKTFSQLASEWKTDEDDKKRMEDMEKATGIDNDAPFVLPTFNNIQRYVEPEDELPEDESPPAPPPTEDDEVGWTTVRNRKPRIKKELVFKEEDFDRSSQDSRDNTVWDTREEHETCWDDRRNY
jgi:hypothetical protein